MMTFLLNLLLALVWLALTGQVTAKNFGFGFAAGYLALLVTRRSSGKVSYFRKGPEAVRFVGFFLWELVQANMRVAYDVITFRHHMEPAVVALPLDLNTDLERVILASVITLTPGTLSIDFSDDRKTLYVHAMYVQDPTEFRASLKDGFERRVQELLR